MESKASIAIGRTGALLRAIGKCVSHRVGTFVTINDVLEASKETGITYGRTGSLDDEMLWHDLWLLSKQDLIQATNQTGPQTSTGAATRGAAGTWKVALAGKGLTRLVELEKSWLRRVYEKNPPAWWMVLLTLGSFAVAIVALLKSFGAFDSRP